MGIILLQALWMLCTKANYSEFMEILVSQMEFGGSSFYYLFSFCFSFFSVFYASVLS
jgi:hypothetical protein